MPLILTTGLISRQISALCSTICMRDTRVLLAHVAAVARHSYNSSRTCIVLKRVCSVDSFFSESAVGLLNVSGYLRCCPQTCQG